MKRILFVSPGFNYGGSTTALLSIMNSTLSLDYDLKVFSISKGDYDSPVLDSRNIGLNEWTKALYANYSELSGRDKLRAFFLKVSRKIPVLNNKIEMWVIKHTIKQIEQVHYDCVVAFQEKQATEFCQFFKVNKKIAWLHCDFPRAYPRTETDLAIYEKYSHIVCVSKATRDSFLGYFPTLTERTVSIYNLFDAERINSQSHCPIQDSRFEGSLFTIISVGRINRVKRFDLIPCIARQLSEMGRRFRWFIIGQPYNEEELTRLNESIKSNKVDNSVIYLGGTGNPYPYFRVADLLVSTSESEACPMIFNEAKLLRLPIVSTDFPSAYEFISEPEEGRISSIDNMADTISSIIEDISHGQLHVPFFNYDESNKAIVSAISELLEA